MARDGPVVVDIGATSADYDTQVLAVLGPGPPPDGTELVDVLGFVPAALVLYRARQRLLAGATLAEVAGGAAVDSVVAVAASQAGKIVAGVAGEPSAGAWAAAAVMLTVGAVREQRRCFEHQRRLDVRIADLVDDVARTWTHS